MGVTILRKEICVLCRTDSLSPPAIRVFQNRNPFRLNAKIDIGEFLEDANDIGSSDEENCIFVLDSKEKCVWRIARQTGDHHKFLNLQSIHFFQWPSKLSVSCDGQRLLLLTRWSLNIYEVFEPEGTTQESISTVELPSDIESPLHAVETSSGHFVIVHRLKQDVRDTADPREEKKRVVVVSKVT